MPRTPPPLTTRARAAGLALARSNSGESQSSASASGAAGAAGSASAAPVPTPTPYDCSSVTVETDSEALPALTGEARQEPAPTWSGGQAPAELTVKTLSQGSGEQIAQDDIIVADYVGWEWGSDQAFDSSWGRGAPAAFSLSAVIPGWTCGLVGTHVGDRVVMSIPADLAYGDKQAAGGAGQAGQGQPSGDLVFVVDVLAGGSSEEIAAGTSGATPEREEDLAERGVSVSGDLGGPATISVQDGAAEPTVPEVIVLARGTGEPLAADSTVLVHSAGVPWDNADSRSSWDQRTPQVMTLNEMPPLDQLVGVPVGSRVVILMPQDPSTGSPASAFVTDIEQAL